MIRSRILYVVLSILLISTVSISAGEKKSIPKQVKNIKTVKHQYKHNIVMHLDSKDQKIQKVSLNNAMALIKSYGKKNIQIEIVILGAGTAIPLVFNESSPYADRIRKMVKMPNVRITACGGSMKKYKKRTGKKLTLITGVNPVPVGIARIVELSEKGYTYLHP